MVIISPTTKMMSKAGYAAWKLESAVTRTGFDQMVFGLDLEKPSLDDCRLKRKCQQTFEEEAPGFGGCDCFSILSAEMTALRSRFQCYLDNCFFCSTSTLLTSKAHLFTVVFDRKCHRLAENNRKKVS